MTHRLLVLPLVMSLGCTGLGGLSNSRSAQLAGLKKQQTRDNNAYGYLPRSALAGKRPEFEPRARPIKLTGKAADAFFPLSLSRATTTQVCFEKNYEPRVGVDAEAEAAAVQRAWSFVVESYPSPERAAAADTWPAQNAVAEVKPLAEGWQLARPALELCLPAPAVAATDTALVVTALSSKSSTQNFVLVWQLVD